MVYLREAAAVGFDFAGDDGGPFGKKVDSASDRVGKPTSVGSAVVYEPR
jgi:hypothetical protein